MRQLSSIPPDRLPTPTPDPDDSFKSSDKSSEPSPSSDEVSSLLLNVPFPIRLQQIGSGPKHVQELVASLMELRGCRGIIPSIIADAIAAYVVVGDPIGPYMFEEKPSMDVDSTSTPSERGKQLFYLRTLVSIRQRTR
ncbi:hypothetical protein GGS20DRAFT_593453 [Poronia punctata]|nr:hypothetical protein GGS20DRAFT_593453 [Poronia punctata]